MLQKLKERDMFELIPALHLPPGRTDLTPLQILVEKNLYKSIVAAKVDHLEKRYLFNTKVFINYFVNFAA